MLLRVRTSITNGNIYVITRVKYKNRMFEEVIVKKWKLSINCNVFMPCQRSSSFNTENVNVNFDLCTVTADYIICMHVSQWSHKLVYTVLWYRPVIFKEMEDYYALTVALGFVFCFFGGIFLLIRPRFKVPPSADGSLIIGNALQVNPSTMHLTFSK